MQHHFLGDADGLKIFVVVDPSGRVATAYPKPEQPGVYENPRKPPSPPDGFIENRPIWKRPELGKELPGYFVYQRKDGTTVNTDQSGRLLPHTDVLPPVPAEGLTLDEKD